MTKKDAKDLVDWLDQAEEEAKATIAEHERIDPFYDGVLSTIQTVREYIKKMRKVDEVEAHNLLDEKLEFVSDYMRNNHGAVEQYGIYLIPEFMLGYDDIEIVVVAVSENERATVVFSDIPVVKRGKRDEE